MDLLYTIIQSKFWLGLAEAMELLEIAEKRLRRSVMLDGTMTVPLMINHGRRYYAASLVQRSKVELLSLI